MWSEDVFFSPPWFKYFGSNFLGIRVIWARMHEHNGSSIESEYMVIVIDFHIWNKPDLPRPRRSAQSAPAGCQPHSFETLGCVIKIFPFLLPPPPLHLNCALRVQGFRFFHFFRKISGFCNFLLKLVVFVLILMNFSRNFTKFSRIHQNLQRFAENSENSWNFDKILSIFGPNACLLGPSGHPSPLVVDSAEKSGSGTFPPQASKWMPVFDPALGGRRWTDA